MWVEDVKCLAWSKTVKERRWKWCYDEAEELLYVIRGNIEGNSIYERLVK